jgi:hypothetical protein
MWVDDYVLRFHKRSLRVDGHAGMGQILGTGRVFESKITYPLAYIQLWFLALGAKRKITYPPADMPADMRFWFLALGHYGVIS